MTAPQTNWTNSGDCDCTYTDSPAVSTYWAPNTEIDVVAAATHWVDPDVIVYSLDFSKTYDSFYLGAI